LCRVRVNASTSRNPETTAATTTMRHNAVLVHIKSRVFCKSIMGRKHVSRALVGEKSEDTREERSSRSYAWLPR
jgi:hypothetical protein